MINGIKGRLTDPLRLPYNFIKGPIIGWDAPKAFVSDMGFLTMPQLVLAAAIGGSAPADVLCGKPERPAAAKGPGAHRSPGVGTAPRRQPLPQRLNRAADSAPPGGKLGRNQSAAAALGLESLDLDSLDFESEELESEPESEPFDSFPPSAPVPPFFFLP